MNNKNKKTEESFEIIYKDKLLTIEEVPFYPGNLKILFNHSSDRVLHQSMLYLMLPLRHLIDFKAFYMTVTRTDASQAKVELYPWTEALVERFKHPSQYRYPDKTEAFTKKLRDLYAKAFHDLPMPFEDIIKLTINLTEPRASFEELPSYLNFSPENVLKNNTLRAEWENCPHFKALKEKGFTLEAVLQNILPPVIIKNYFICIEKNAFHNKKNEEIFNDIQSIFALLSEIKSNRSETHEKKGKLSLVK